MKKSFENYAKSGPQSCKNVAKGMKWRKDGSHFRSILVFGVKWREFDPILVPVWFFGIILDQYAFWYDFSSILHPILDPFLSQSKITRPPYSRSSAKSNKKEWFREAKNAIGKCMKCAWKFDAKMDVRGGDNRAAVRHLLQFVKFQRFRNVTNT